MKKELDKGEDGVLSRTVSNLWELIDRYVPRHTREEFVQMSRVYEERIFDLLQTIHEYHERCDRMQKHMHGLEREYYEKVAIPVSFGKLDASVELHHMDFTKTYQVTWRPDPLRVCIRVGDNPFDKDKCPHLFEATMRQFREHLTTHLVDDLSRQYGKLYVR